MDGWKVVYWSLSVFLYRSSSASPRKLSLKTSAFNFTFVRWRNFCLISALTFPIKNIHIHYTNKFEYMFTIKSRKGLAELLYDRNSLLLLLDRMNSHTHSMENELVNFFVTYGVTECLCFQPTNDKRQWKRRRKKKEETFDKTAIVNYWSKIIASVCVVLYSERIHEMIIKVLMPSQRQLLIHNHFALAFGGTMEKRDSLSWFN